MQPVLVDRRQFVPQRLVQIFDNPCVTLHRRSSPPWPAACPCPPALLVNHRNDGVETSPATRPLAKSAKHGARRHDDAVGPRLQLACRSAQFLVGQHIAGTDDHLASGPAEHARPALRKVELSRLHMGHVRPRQTECGAVVRRSRGIVSVTACKAMRLTPSLSGSAFDRTPRRPAALPHGKRADPRDFSRTSSYPPGIVFIFLINRTIPAASCRTIQPTLTCPIVKIYQRLVELSYLLRETT